MPGASGGGEHAESRRLSRTDFELIDRPPKPTMPGTPDAARERRALPGSTPHAKGRMPC